MSETEYLTARQISENMGISKVSNSFYAYLGELVARGDLEKEDNNPNLLPSKRKWKRVKTDEDLQSD
jgi:hypothetical protein